MNNRLISIGNKSLLLGSVGFLLVGCANDESAIKSEQPSTEEATVETEAENNSEITLVEDPTLTFYPKISYAIETPEEFEEVLDALEVFINEKTSGDDPNGPYGDNQLVEMFVKENPTYNGIELSPIQLANMRRNRYKNIFNQGMTETFNGAFIEADELFRIHETALLVNTNIDTEQSSNSLYEFTDKYNVSKSGFIIEIDGEEIEVETQLEHSDDLKEATLIRLQVDGKNILNTNN